MECKEEKQCQTAYLFDEQVVVDAHEKQEHIQRDLEDIAGFLCECTYLVAGIQALPIAEEQCERACEHSKDREQLNRLPSASGKDVEP